MSEMKTDQFDILLDSGRSALRIALSLIPKKYGAVVLRGETCRVVYDVIESAGFKLTDDDYDAVIATQPCNMFDFEHLDIPVIEDAARFCPPGYRGVGDFTIFSFNWGKPICMGGGGALNVKDKETREKARMLVSETGSYWQSRLRGMMFEPSLYQLGKKILWFYEPRYDHEPPRLMNPKLVKLLKRRTENETRG